MKKFCSYSLVIFFLHIFLQVHAQTQVRVMIKNENGLALDGATVELHRSNDSALVKIAFSDKYGWAEFDRINQGNYRIKASFNEHGIGWSKTFTVSREAEIIVSEISLVPGQKELTNITVSAKKPFIQRLTDRLVVNVDNSIVNAGSTALEILEHSPGVSISSEDVISMRGRSGVLVMIDGKLTAMTGSDLVNYLKTLPSTAIERIDLITNPSSKYDAAGTAGIIDIRLKKDQRFGTNGTATVAFGHGRFPKLNTVIAFNHRNKKINVYGSVGNNFLKYFNNLVLTRYFYETGLYAGSYDQNNMIRRSTDIPQARIGIDLYIGKRTVIGMVTNASMYLTQRSSQNNSWVLDKNGILLSSFHTTASGRENFRNIVTNLNARHSFDSTGKELSVDLDYGDFVQDWASRFTTIYKSYTGTQPPPDYLLRSDQDGHLNFKTAKLDYTHPVSKKFKWELGAKTSFVHSNNQVRFFDETNGSSILDMGKSNHFFYDENVNAAYLNNIFQLGKFSFQAGLRAEHTHVKTYQVVKDVHFDSSYLNLFTSLFANYRISEKNSFGFSVSKRIDRPSYGQLNPFRIFVDPSFYASGNPALLPPITWSYEFNYTVKNLNIGLSYSKTQKPIITVLMPTENRVTLQTNVNLGSYNYYGLISSFPLKLGKWWNQVNNFNFYYGAYTGIVAETNIDKGAFSAQLSTNNSFVFKNDWSAELNFSYFSGINNFVMRDRSSYILSAGIQKALWNKKATIKLNATDILYRQWPRFKSYFTNYREVLSAIRDTRVVYLNFIYKFGNNKVQAARRRSTGSEEERRRAGGN